MPIFHVFPGFLIEWISNKSDFYIQLVNELLCVCKANMFQQFSTNNCKYTENVNNLD